MNSTILRVQVDDDTLDTLRHRSDTLRRDLEFTASHLLKTAARDLPVAGRTVVLDDQALQVLEPILGAGSVLNGQDLVLKVERLAGISLRHVRLDFTPNQLEDLTRRAASNGLTVEQLIERTAPRIYEQFFGLLAI